MGACCICAANNFHAELLVEEWMNKGILYTTPTGSPIYPKKKKPVLLFTKKKNSPKKTNRFPWQCPTILRIVLDALIGVISSKNPNETSFSVIKSIFPFQYKALSLMLKVSANWQIIKIIFMNACVNYTI